MVNKKICVRDFTDGVFKNTDEFCRKILKYESSITFKHNNIEGNAKSVLSMLSMCANAGDEIEIICDGQDEKAALKAIGEMLEKGSCD